MTSFASPDRGIPYINRQTKAIEYEKVYGEKLVQWLYGSKSGTFLSHVLCKAPLSKVYGLFQDSSLSCKKIDSFVKDFQINLDDFIPTVSGGLFPYKSFNDFFIRKFKEGKRNFVQSSKALGAFAEGRYIGLKETSPDQRFPVKGKELSASQILKNEKWAQAFEGGPLFIARLCPVDYHRFHFPDKGKILESYVIKGNLHSVNPVALKFKEDIFSTNERHVTILETENFGKLAYVEVGAICVGKIVQTYGNKKTFHKGEEKGFFLFGGSTVILLGEKGKWIPDEDILQNTKEGKETLIRLGERVAAALE